MGWASGSELAEKVWELLESMIDYNIAKPHVALKLVEIFEDYNADSMYECDFVRKYLIFNDDKGEYGEWEIRKHIDWSKDD